MTISWDAAGWLRRFWDASQAGAGFRECRREVFSSTIDIVRAGQYDAGLVGLALHRIVDVENRLWPIYTSAKTHRSCTTLESLD